MAGPRSATFLLVIAFLTACGRQADSSVVESIQPSRAASQPAASEAAPATEPLTTPPSSPAPSVACLIPPPDLQAVIDQPDPAACYGPMELTFEGWVTAIGTYDPVLFLEPAWLCCPTFELQARANQFDPFGLWFVVHPESGVNDLGASPGTSNDLHARVTGHFDDPAALSCEFTEDYSHLGVAPGEAVPVCRGTFVVTSLVLL